MNWLDALCEARNSGQAFVLVTIIDVQGSAPRGVGTRMLVLRDSETGTIGGGALEFKATSVAKKIIDEDSVHARIFSDSYPLAKALSQCCGGRVTLQFDFTPRTDFNVAIFGAGHVSQALVKILSDIRCHVTVFDDRIECLEKISAQPEADGRIDVAKLDNNPFDCVAACKPDTAYFVMTHSHDLDYLCVEAVLGRNDIQYCGLIASKSKAAAFKSRLARKEFTSDEIARLTAPIGQHFKTGNQPMEVAVAAVSDLLGVRNAVTPARNNVRSISGGVKSS